MIITRLTPKESNMNRDDGVLICRIYRWCFLYSNCPAALNKEYKHDIS